MIRRIARKSRRKATEKRQATVRSLGKPIGTAEVAMEVTTLRIYRVHYSEYSICPWCKIPMEREFINFCSNCGQRLSWELYLQGDIETEYYPQLLQNEEFSPEDPSQKEDLAVK